MLYVVILVTAVAGYDLSEHPPDTAQRMGQYMTHTQCERDAAWWNRRWAEIKREDGRDVLDTGLAVCIPQPEERKAGG